MSRRGPRLLPGQLRHCGDGGTTTTLTGTLYDPSGNFPIYNGVVYVPAGEPAAVPVGADCTRCAASAKALTAATTNPQGKFVLTNVPVTTGVPIVVQAGRFRRIVTTDITNACGANTIGCGSMATHGTVCFLRVG